MKKTLLTIILLFLPALASLDTVPQPLYTRHDINRFECGNNKMYWFFDTLEIWYSNDSIIHNYKKIEAPLDTFIWFYVDTLNSTSSWYTDTVIIDFQQAGTLSVGTATTVTSSGEYGLVFVHDGQWLSDTSIAVMPHIDTLLILSRTYTSGIPATIRYDLGFIKWTPGTTIINTGSRIITNKTIQHNRYTYSILGKKIGSTGNATQIIINNNRKKIILNR